MDDLSARLRAKTPCCPDGPSMVFLHEAADLIDSLTRERDEWDRIVKFAVEEVLVPLGGVVDPPPGLTGPMLMLLLDDLKGHVLELRSERDELAATVERLREAADRVNRAWLRGDIDGPDGEGPAALLALHRAADTEEVGDRGE